MPQPFDTRAAAPKAGGQAGVGPGYLSPLGQRRDSVPCPIWHLVKPAGRSRAGGFLWILNCTSGSGCFQTHSRSGVQKK